MAGQDDLILEGVSAGEVASLRALAGGTVPAQREIAPLHAKGWVEVVGSHTLITLTGRTLLDRQPSGLR